MDVSRFDKSTLHPTSDVRPPKRLLAFHRALLFLLSISHRVALPRRSHPCSSDLLATTTMLSFGRVSRLGHAKCIVLTTGRILLIFTTRSTDTMLPQVALPLLDVLPVSHKRSILISTLSQRRTSTESVLWGRIANDADAHASSIYTQSASCTSWPTLVPTPQQFAIDDTYLSQVEVSPTAH